MTSKPPSMPEAHPTGQQGHPQCSGATFVTIYYDIIIESADSASTKLWQGHKGDGTGHVRWGRAHVYPLPSRCLSQSRQTCKTQCTVANMPSMPTFVVGSQNASSLPPPGAYILYVPHLASWQN